MTRLLVAGVVWVAGCSRAPEPVPPAKPQTPSPASAATASATPKFVGGSVETETTIVGNAVVNGSDSTAAPAATPPGPAEMQAEPEQNIPSLLNAYRAATDTMDRERFAFDIEAIGTPEAGAAFASLASTESDEELKSLLLTLLADSEATVETKIAAFAEALRPGQSEMVREAAADSLQGVEDPRTIAVWRQFLSDPLVGDIAKDAIEFLESRKE